MSVLHSNHSNLHQARALTNDRMQEECEQSWGTYMQTAPGVCRMGDVTQTDGTQRCPVTQWLACMCGERITDITAHKPCTTHLA